MTQPTNTFDTYDAVGIREDLSDVIYNISPTEFPFWTSIQKGKPAENTYHEWQTDALAAAAQNAVIEGDEATMDASVATVRLGNRTQISDKTVTITGTQDAVRKAGRDRELAYQIAKKGKELKRDIETILSQNFAIVTGNSSTARQMASFETWIQTNASRGASGAAAANTGGQPNSGAQPTDGTQRAFVESDYKSVLQQCWTQGGNPNLTVVGPFNKRALSGFTGNATRQVEARSKKLVTSIDVYEHDFGTCTVVPSRFSRDRSALILDTEYWAMCWLRPIQIWELAKTGDTEKRQLLGEYTMEARQQASSGIVADLTTS